MGKHSATRINTPLHIMESIKKVDNKTPWFLISRSKETKQGNTRQEAAGVGGAARGTLVSIVAPF